jgi:16S rRNA G1207 methylase RsmC
MGCERATAAKKRHFGFVAQLLDHFPFLMGLREDSTSKFDVKWEEKRRQGKDIIIVSQWGIFSYEKRF